MCLPIDQDGFLRGMSGRCPVAWEMSGCLGDAAVEQRPSTDLAMIQALAGHASPATTARYDRTGAFAMSSGNSGTACLLILALAWIRFAAKREGRNDHISESRVAIGWWAWIRAAIPVPSGGTGPCRPSLRKVVLTPRALESTAKWPLRAYWASYAAPAHLCRPSLPRTSAAVNRQIAPY